MDRHRLCGGGVEHTEGVGEVDHDERVERRGSGPPKPDSPKHAVEAFIAEVDKGDWKAACDLVDPKGRFGFVFRIGLNLNTDVDKFGQLKDCPGALAKHADRLRAEVKGWEPGSSRPYRGGALVSSPKGDWVTVQAPGGSKNWLIDGFPPPH